MIEETPTLEQVLAHAAEKRLLDVHTSIPGAVVDYDSTKQTATIQPLIRASREDEAGELIVERLPILNDVPVSFVGAGNCSITWPLAKGDTGMIFFAEGSIAKWKQTGGDVDPDDDRRFSISDAVFLPGLRSLKNKVPAAGVHATAMTLRAPLIHAGGTQSLAFADHTHLDSNGMETSGPITGTLPNPGYNPMLPVGPSNPLLISAGSDGGTTILKGA